MLFIFTYRSILALRVLTQKTYVISKYNHVPNLLCGCYDVTPFVLIVLRVVLGKVHRDSYISALNSRCQA